jgi:hypothetical protein
LGSTVQPSAEKWAHVGARPNDTNAARLAYRNVPGLLLDADELSVQSTSPRIAIAVRPTSERVDAQRRVQKHSQGPKQVLGVPPLQAICEE